MTVVYAIDPGPKQSGVAIYSNGAVHKTYVCENEQILWVIERIDLGTECAIEMIASYGMPVGREVFETCLWIGRFQQAWFDKFKKLPKLIYRQQVKLHLCGSPKAKDGNVRQALIDLFPATGGGKVPQIGTKKQPGPLYGVSSHAWPALGVAVTALAKEAV